MKQTPISHLAAHHDNYRTAHFWQFWKFNARLTTAIAALTIAASTLTLKTAQAADPFVNILGGGAAINDGLYLSTESNPQSTPPAAPGVYENRIRYITLISKDDRDTWGAQATLGNLHFGTAPVFTDTAKTAPLNLWDLEFGATFRRKLESERELSASLSIGSLSDVPFNSLSETTFQFNGTYRFPAASPRAAWLLAVNWTNNRPFLNYIPLFGIVYSYRSEDRHLIYSVGFPFNLIYTEFAPGWSARASLIGISQAGVELAKEVYFPARLYAAFDWGQRVWLTAGRVDSSDRLFFDQVKTSIGFRTPLSVFLMADLSVGYQTARRLFISPNYYGYSGGGKVSLDSGWVVQLILSFRDLKKPMF